MENKFYVSYMGEEIIDVYECVESVRVEEVQVPDWLAGFPEHVTVDRCEILMYLKDVSSHYAGSDAQENFNRARKCFMPGYRYITKKMMKDYDASHDRTFYTDTPRVQQSGRVWSALMMLCDETLEQDFAELPKSFTIPRHVYMQELFYWIKKGRRIDAIKLLRKLTGDGLKDAKEDIEMLEEFEYELETDPTYLRSLMA